MLFKELAELIEQQFQKMTQTGKLFVSTLSGKELWDLYLNSFNPEDDPIYRDPNRSVHNCNRDRQFIERFGNIITFDSEGNMMTMFDVDTKNSVYENSMANMKKALREHSIKEILRLSWRDINQSFPQKKNKDSYQLGFVNTVKKWTKEEAEKFPGTVDPNEIKVFYHFYIQLPKEYVDFTDKSISSLVNTLTETHTLFLKGLSIPLETLETVRDLFIQGSLLKSSAYIDKIKSFIKLKQDYESQSNKTLWAWNNFESIPFARFSQELIGVTCIELAEGKDINKVCKDFNLRVDPANYMKAQAPITQRQIDDAASKVEELGYSESFDRRFATLKDININEILHQNKTKTSNKKGGALFANVKPTASTVAVNRHKRAQLENVEEVSIGTFMEEILPHSKSVEVLVENNFKNNFVALTTSNNPEAKNPFKWTNTFSKTYKGNLAGMSFIKEAVKNAGGSVEGIIRGSIIWNESGSDRSDLDIWCNEPNTQIGYSKPYMRHQGNFSPAGGQLDVDNTNPGSKLGVENIYYPDENKLVNGTYSFYVNQYSPRYSQGFKFELEVNGEVFTYEYDRPLTNKQNVEIATVTYKDGNFTVEHHYQPSETKYGNIWELEVNKFHKVNLLCLSPNYWGDNKVGEKHYLFMLDGCVPDEPLRSFHNEDLNGELREIRKVMDILGHNTKLEPIKGQLAGLGFTDDSDSTLIVKIKGNFERTLKIKF